MTIRKDNAGLFFGTVGARTSRKYLRVYDKGIESKSAAAGMYWRIELEAKRELAGQLWEQMKVAPDHYGWCYSCCESACRSSGRSWRLPLGSEAVVMPPAKGADPPEVERTLRWLREMVRPSITRLLEAKGPAVVIEALGMQDYVTVDEFFEYSREAHASMGTHHRRDGAT